MKVVLSDKKGIAAAVNILNNGGVIVYPTDTAYALGGIFDKKKVLDRILKIKNRQDEKFTLVCSSLIQVQKFFKFSLEQEKMAKKFWPGPLSITVGNKFAVRVPDNDLAKELARQVGKPLIATSANLTGNQKNFYKIEDIVSEFENKKDQPDLFLDGGQIEKVEPSTLVKVFRGEIKVLRQGSIKVKS